MASNLIQSASAIRAALENEADADKARQQQRQLLYELARSENLWYQRIAILTTFAFLRAGEFEDTFRIANLLLNHPHDLIHKAVGWMLREVGNREISRTAAAGVLKGADLSH